MIIKAQFQSSLAKIFPDSEPTGRYISDSALRGETFAWQLAYRFEETWVNSVKVSIDSPLAKHVRVRRVELIPVRFTACVFDDDVISRSPGLYPDPLPVINAPFRVPKDQWHSLWIDISVPTSCKPGKYPVSITLENAEYSIPQKLTKTFTLEVLNAILPEQELIHTEWFHADCVASVHHVPVWSDEHWRILKNYFRSATSHGINMLLTPLFTPPLDTAVGGERPTVQLVGVSCKKNQYSFDFSNLDRWIKLAQECGYEYFEMSHLFTQWGAAFTPKIIAHVDGQDKRIFGWNVKSDSPKYRRFLSAFLPELTKFIDERGLREKVYFHCSDEPGPAHLETYGKAVALLRKLLPGFHFCDALSNLEFYSNGLVSTPIPSCNHIEPFVEAGVQPLWTYYCCGQITKVPNRFLHFPSSRNRILGALLYRYDCAGFLQWGFNFFYSQYSLRVIDPWQMTDSDYGFPAGDPFMVYPGPDGTVVDSLKLEVLSAGLQDLRALKLLETKLGRKKVEAFLDRITPTGHMTMTEYPRGEKAVLDLRKKINAKIREVFA